MFSELTREELNTLSAKIDRAAEVGEAQGYDYRVTSDVRDVRGVQADLYDARADAFHAAVGKPEMEADREAEAGQ
jgi:cell division inhibitor SulA